MPALEKCSTLLTITSMRKSSTLHQSIPTYFRAQPWDGGAAGWRLIDLLSFYFLSLYSAACGSQALIAGNGTSPIPFARWKHGCLRRRDALREKRKKTPPTRAENIATDLPPSAAPEPDAAGTEDARPPTYRPWSGAPSRYVSLCQQWIVKFLLP